MKHKVIVWGVTSVVLLAAAGIIAHIVLRPKPLVPQDIRSQLTSTLLLPKTDDSKEVIINKQSFKFDKDLKLLTFTMSIYNTNAVVSEQPTPDTFVDIPDVYNKLIAGFGEYSKFDSVQGTVHLVRSAKIQNQQAAVLNTKGTLLFIKPDGDLSNDDWKRFFNTLAVSD